MDTIGVGFDVWFSEGSLHAGDPSPVYRAFDELERREETYRSEGALWLRTSAHGEQKDDVLERSTGEPSYLASDIAYHLDKRERGFDRLIDVWGADHHGHVARMHAAFEALGGPEGQLELIIMQFVNIIERGERAQMSKRRGEFVTLDELIEQIGVDAVRFFMLQRSHDTTIDLDLDLAREQSSENPVYYVQYAHARIASILAKAGGDARVSAALEEARPVRRHARARRANARQEAARLPRRDRRGDRAARAAPHRRLRARARADVHGLLPRLPGRRRRGRGHGVLPAGAERHDEAHDRAGAVPARGERARQDGDRARARSAVVAGEILVEARRVGVAELRSAAGVSAAARRRGPRRRRRSPSPPPAAAASAARAARASRPRARRARSGSRRR